MKKSRAYLHEARQGLQEFFSEEHLCNGTGLCAQCEFSADNCLGTNKFQDEVKNFDTTLHYDWKKEEESTNL